MPDAQTTRRARLVMDTGEPPSSVHVVLLRYLFRRFLDAGCPEDNRVALFTDMAAHVLGMPASSDADRHAVVAFLVQLMHVGLVRELGGARTREHLVDTITTVGNLHHGGGIEGPDTYHVVRLSRGIADALRSTPAAFVAYVTTDPKEPR